MKTKEYEIVAYELDSNTEITIKKGEIIEAV